jgi:antitoxin component of RelBE/YafQ-DinJ toxin-antitoxin module
MKVIITESQYNLLRENKKKRLFIKMLGQDLIDSIRTIDSAKELPKEFLKSLGSWSIQQYIDAYGPLYYFVFNGESFIYKHRFKEPKGEYEMFTNSKGKSFFNDEINNRLGLSDIGLRFLDVINTISNEGEPLNENVDKNKRLLINVMGQDFTDKIKMITSTYDVPMSFDEGVGPNLINRWLNHWGPMYLVNVKGKDYLYQNRGDFEMFIDEEGYDYVDDEITEQIGISDMGLKFSDIIDIFFNEGEPLNESVDKNKRLLINVMGEDLTGKIKQIKSGYDIPTVFRKYLELGNVKKQIDMVGPMYYVKIGGKGYLYQDHSKFYQSHNDASFGEMFMGEDGKRDYSGKVPEQLGVSELGLKFSDIINMFYDEEKSPNMNVDDKKIKVMERFIDDVFSEYDWYEGLDIKVESFTFKTPEYKVPLYVFYLMSNDRLQANIDLIEYENSDDDIDEMFSSLFPKDKTDGRRYTALYVIRVA